MEIDEDRTSCYVILFLSTTYEEWNQSLLAILGDGRGQCIASHTELVVALDVAQFDQPDQSGFLH
jgi:hypothetical protein